MKFQKPPESVYRRGLLFRRRAGPWLQTGLRTRIFVNGGRLFAFDTGEASGRMACQGEKSCFHATVLRGVDCELRLLNWRRYSNVLAHSVQ